MSTCTETKSLDFSAQESMDMQLNPLGKCANGNGGVPINISNPTKKLIHFSDGSTMEDDDDDDEAVDSSLSFPGVGNFSENTITKSAVQTLSSVPVPALDTSKMTWREYARHVAISTGIRTITMLEGMGGSASYYLGITTPKYQAEIDEYNRMVTKKKAQAEELMSWSSGPDNQGQPVVEDVKNEKGDAISK